MQEVLAPGISAVCHTKAGDCLQVSGLQTLVPTITRGERACLLSFSLVQVPPQTPHALNATACLFLAFLLDAEVSVEEQGYTSPGDPVN